MTRNHLSGGTRRFALCLANLRSRPQAWVRLLFLTLPLLLSSASGHAQWTAFFDFSRGPGTASTNVLSFESNTDSGYLTNQFTGEPLPAFLRLSVTGGTATSLIEGLVSATPAYSVFTGFCDLKGYSPGYIDNDTKTCSITISGLSPSARYKLVSTVNRNYSAYSGRITRVELQGADTCVPAHTLGVITNGLPVSEAGLICYNAAGEYVAWSDIDPGTDGTLVLTSSRFTNQTAYALVALKIQELPRPVGISSQPQDAAACPESSFTLALDVAGSLPITFNWFVITNGATNLVATGTNSTLTLTNVQQSFSWFAAASNAVNQTTTSVAQVSVTTEIVIATQPAPQHVAIGQPASFSVGVASGCPQYQWFKDGSVIPNATNATYLIPAVSTNDLGQYAVVLTNMYQASVMSGEAALTIATNLVLFVARTNLNAADLAIFNQLTALGFAVVVQDDRTAASSNAIGKSLIAISSTADPAEVGGTFMLSPVPILCWQPRLFNAHYLIASPAYQGTIPDQQGISIYDPSLPISADLTGTNLVFSSPQSLSYGVPGPNAVVAAVATNGTELPVFFSYEKGAAAAIPVMSLPARRIGFFLGETNATSLTTAGSNLFAAAVRWADSPPVPTNAPVGISKQPASVSVPAGLNATFSVNVTGAPPYYLQWRRNGTNIPGATGRTLTLGPVSDSDNNATFTLYATNRIRTAVTSSVATLTVSGPIPIAITSQPQSRTLAPGQTATFTVGITGGSPRFQWFKNGIPVSDATNQSYSIPNVGLRDTAAYHVVITNTVNAVTSATAFLFVQPPGYQLLDLSHTWKYNQDAVDLGANWFATDFDDSAWPSGPGMLAHENNTAINPFIGTTLNLTTNGRNTRTYYFRTSFSLTNEPSTVLLTANCYFDDGAVVYLNGQEAFRINMPQGFISYSTLAPGFATEPSSTITWMTNNLPAGLLRKGLNYLAVEVHQDSPTSSDIVMGMWATLNEPIPTPLAINRQPQDVAVDELRPATMSVEWTGTPAFFQWYKGTPESPIILPGANSPALIFSNPVAGVDEGTYFVEVTNVFYRAISQPATLTITQAPPSFLELAPVAAACPGEPVALKATTFGTQPLYYQWRFNHADIPHATNATLVLESANTIDTGAYSVFVSNALGTALSSTTLLHVSTTPIILSQPCPQASGSGGTVTFRVLAGGCQPLSYQWQFNEAPILGATNPALNMQNLQLTNEGLYRVTISNPGGGVTSSEVPLTIDLGRALNCTNVLWLNGPTQTYNHSSQGYELWLVKDSPECMWFPDSALTRDGVAAIRSGASFGKHASSLKTTITGPARFSFWWRLNKTDTKSALIWKVDNDDFGTIFPTTTNWEQKVFYFAAGTHSLEWRFALNGSTNHTVAWIDQVEYATNGLGPQIVSSPQSPVISAGGNARFSVAVDGYPGFKYQWQWNGVDLPNATLPLLTVANAKSADAGTYTVVVANDFGAVTSMVAELTVEDAAPAAPTFLAQRPYVLTTPGGDVALHAGVSGSDPMNFQWYFQGLAIPGATNELLFLRNLTANQVGRYQVTATNSLGGALGPELELILSKISHVIHISGDGLAGKYLGGALWAEPERYPNFLKIAKEGSYTLNARCDFTDSVTVPNHLCMITGRPVRQPDGQPDTVHHGFLPDYSWSGWTIHNMGNTNVSYQTSVFDVAHDHGLTTTMMLGKTSLSICADSYNATNGAPDLILPDHGSNKIDFVLFGGNSSNIVENFLPSLRSNAPFNYAFLHFSELDAVGHSYTWASPAWLNALARMDIQIGRLLAAIETNANPDVRYGTAVIITADHGGEGSNHTNPVHPYNYTIPLLVWGPGFPGGTDLYTRFANRADPGTNRLDYNAVWQPLRNGDTGNLALSMLGLPPIPGSTLIPLPPTDSPSLVIVPALQGYTLQWSAAASAFTLETSDTIAPGATWTPVTFGITTNSLTLTYPIPDTSPRFYRLRKN